MTPSLFHLPAGGGLSHPYFASGRIRQELELSPPPAFFHLPIWMQAGQQSWQQGKKKKIDYLYEINISSR